MSYDMLSKYEHYSPSRRRKKQNKYKTLGIYVLISLVVQMSALWGADAFLKEDSEIDLEPTKEITVKEAEIALNPAPNDPGMMAISSDSSRVALVDGERIRIYDLNNGKELNSFDLDGAEPAALEWLPDRNRLIFAVVDEKVIKETVKSPYKPNAGTVKDETYSTDTYRDETITKEGFQLDIYSVEESQGPEPVLIKSLKESGSIPDKVKLNMSTYTNLLYINWERDKKAHLAQVDIMQRIKDFTLPRGELSKLVISQKDGTLWAETMEDNSASIYKYEKSRWRLQQQLDGYRLLGITPDDELAVAPDQNGEAKEVLLANSEGDLKPRWAFTKPLSVANVTILSDGRLLYLDEDRIVVHSQQLGEGTVYKISSQASFSADGKAVALWQPGKNSIKVLREVVEMKQQEKQ